MNPGMTDEQIKEKIKELVLKNSFYQGELKENHHLFGALDYESLAFAALVVDLETAFSISITKEDVSKMYTPKKIFALVQRKRMHV